MLASSSSRPSRRFVRIAVWADRHPHSLLGFLIAYSCLLVLSQASLKLLWADELITLSIAKQPGIAGVWRALVAGADPNPPLIHLMVQASTHSFGFSSLAVRLPAILCVSFTLLFVWAILRRWVRPVFAAAGVLAFMATRGFDYAYDARSYAPLMAFTMAGFALWVWLPGVPGWWRVFLYAGLAASLAGAVSSNYYGVLAVLPVAAGELARTSRAGKIHLGVWLSLAFGVLPVFWYLPLIQNNLAEFGPHAWNRPRLGMVVSSYLELVEAVFWPVFLAAGYILLRERRVRFAVPRPELVATGVLLAYPVLGCCLAAAGSAMISPRCVVPVCCGFGLAAGLLCQRVLGRSPKAGFAVVLFLLVWVSVREIACARLLLKQRRAFLALCDDVEHHARGRIVLADSAFALPLSFYSSRPVQARMVFPIDFAAIHQDEPDDSGEENLWAGRDGVFPISIVPFSLLLPLRQDDLVLARADGWLAHQAEANGFRMVPLPSEATPMWKDLGGVFTPMGHPETREWRIVASAR